MPPRTHISWMAGVSKSQISCSALLEALVLESYVVGKQKQWMEEDWMVWGKFPRVMYAGLYCHLVVAICKLAWHVRICLLTHVFPLKMMASNLFGTIWLDFWLKPTFDPNQCLVFLPLRHQQTSVTVDVKYDWMQLFRSDQSVWSFMYCGRAPWYTEHVW
jgi:hypothetical protein